MSKLFHPVRASPTRTPSHILTFRLQLTLQVAGVRNSGAPRTALVPSMAGSLNSSATNATGPYRVDGRTAPPTDVADNCLTLQSLCNAFLTSKKHQRDANELTPASFEDYYMTCELLIDQFGRDRRVDDLRSDDFARLRRSMAKPWGPVQLGNTITRIRMVFKYAFDERMIEQLMQYGQSFVPPSSKTLPKSRNQSAPQLFGADEIHTILEMSDQPMKAMVLLGINCGLPPSVGFSI